MSDRVEDFFKPKQAKDVPIEDDEPFEFGFSFEIDNIKTMQFDEPVYSRPCIVHDLAWKMMVRKNGKNATLGFFLHCEPVSKRFEGYWSCYAIAKFTIVNKKNSLNNFSREIKHTFCEKEFDWGYSSFHVLNDLFNSKLEISNSVKFQVSVLAYTPIFSDINNENSEYLESPDDEVDEREDHIETDINYLKSEINSLATNLRTEIISSFKTDLRKDLAEIMKQICVDVVAHINSEGENGGNGIYLGEKKKEIEKKTENSASTEVRNENVTAQVDTVVAENLQKIVQEILVVREIPKIMNEKRESKVGTVVEKIPEKVGTEYKAKADVVTKIPETTNEDNKIVSTDENKSVARVVTEELENSIDDFEIVSGVEDENFEDKNSDTSLSFEMISKDIDNNSRAFHMSDKTAKSNLLICIVEEHFANKSTECLVSTNYVTDLVDTVENRFLEILEAPAEDVLKSGNQSNTINQKMKSYENELDEIVKDIMERNPTLASGDMVEERLNGTATHETKNVKKSSATKTDVINCPQRKQVDFVQSSCPLALHCTDTE